jgi:hypothetical protein
MDASRLHVTLLAQAPEKTVLKLLEKISAGPDRFN